MFTYSAVLATVEDPDLKPDVNDGHKTATDSSSGWGRVLCVCVCVRVRVCVCVCVLYKLCSCLHMAVLTVGNKNSSQPCRKETILSLALL